MVIINDFLASDALQNLATLVVGLAGVLIAAAQFRRSRIEAILKFFEEGDSIEQKKMRAKIHQMSGQELADTINLWLNEEKGADEAFTSIVSFYDKWGKLAMQHYLPLKAFEGMSGYIVMRMYKKLEPYIEARRIQVEMEKGIPKFCYSYYFEQLNIVVANKRKEYKFNKAPKDRTLRGRLSNLIS